MRRNLCRWVSCYLGLALSLAMTPVQARSTSSGPAKPITKVSIADATVQEPKTLVESHILKFRVSLSQPAIVPVVMDYVTKNGTATSNFPNSDYGALAGRITIPRGQTSANIQVYVIGDYVPETDETFTVQLSHLTGAVFSKSVATGTILDRDTADLQVTSEGVTEGDAGQQVMNVTVSLTDSIFGSERSVTQRPIPFTFATQGGTATAGIDYIPVQDSYTIMPGKSSVKFSIPVIGDKEVEADETIGAVVNSPGNRIKVLAGNLVIFDDDAPATFGRLVFSTGSESFFSGEKSAIVSIKTDGTGRKELTDAQSANLHPVVSPDGNKVAFYSDRDSSTADNTFFKEFSLYVMNVDGSSLQRLATVVIYSGPDVCWSPDSSKLAFSSFDLDAQSGAIYTVGVDGLGLKQITAKKKGKFSFQPSFLPGGQQILHLTAHPDSTCNLDLRSINGAGLRTIRDGVDNYALSPDGEFAAILGYNPDDSSRIVDVVGINRQGTRIFQLPQEDFALKLKFSTDGQFLFMRNRSDYSDKCIAFRSLKLADGLTRKLINASSSDPEFYESDDFALSPDGKWIGFGGTKRLGLVSIQSGYVRFVPNAVGSSINFMAPISERKTKAATPVLAAPVPSGKAS
ncbi:hypothetical protein EON80_11340 [bacterium]|nr:MAG: hypothetical protein EON80_11340 [bacterium]